MSIKTVVMGGAYWIIFDNAKRKNAIASKTYDALCAAMDEADENEETLVTVITGDGEYYSSGNDFSPAEVSERPALSDKDYELPYSRWMRRLIDHKKILIGLVNGPAIGIACTTLCLFDYVVCSDTAYFYCPFPYIGVCPEGTSSKSFQRILGPSKANEMVLLGERMTAAEALQRGFVAKIIPQAQFKKVTEELVAKYAALPKHSVLASKQLTKGDGWRREMKSIHDTEYETLVKLMESEETMELVMKRFAPKSKI